MAVGLENTVTGNSISGTGVSSFSNTMTVTSANALLFMISLNLVSTQPTVTWDSGGTNQAMTLIGSGTTNQFNWIFGLLGPTTGTKTIAASWGAASDYGAGLIGLTGVNQTSIAVAFTNFAMATGTSASPTITITAISGNAAFGLAGDNDSTNTETSISQTTLFKVNASTNSANFIGQYAIPASGNTTFSYTAGSSVNPWEYIGVQAVASGGGGDTLAGAHMRILMQRAMVGWRRTLRGLLVPDHAWSM